MRALRYILLIALLGCQDIPTADMFDYFDVDAASVADGMDADGAADVADGLDVNIGPDVLDAADVADAVDTVEPADGADVLDAEDAADAPDTTDTLDVADPVDAAGMDGAVDSANSTAPYDVLDATDAAAADDAAGADDDAATVDALDAADDVDTAAFSGVDDTSVAVDAVDLVDTAATADVADSADEPDALADAPTDAVDDTTPDADVQPDAAADVVVDPCAGKNCDDGNACTTDSCTVGACQNVNLPDWSTCGDGLVCDGAGTCADVKTAKGMAYIPAGTFWMGCDSSKCNSNESPQHKVTLSAYYMDLTETTVAQYKACVDVAVCTVPSTQSPSTLATYPGYPNNPVNYVNWTQALAYCKWRGSAYDLPTEAQWEMAARGSCEKNGSSAGDAGCAAAMRTYPWGEADATCSYAVMGNGTSAGCGTNMTWAVGLIPAGDSPYGLHDMAGNVLEWNRDWFDAYGSGAVTDPVGPGSATQRVCRGGNFYMIDAGVRAGHRHTGVPSYAADGVGLRCMRSLAPAPDLCANVTCPAISCATNTCDPGTGKCVATTQPDGASCEDGSACTSNDQCSAGLCVGTALNCANLDGICQQGVCDPATSGCVLKYLSSATDCSDGDACTISDHCDGAGKCSGTAMMCAATGDPCMTSYCEGGTCKTSTSGDGTACSDGSTCTNADVCTAGVCSGKSVTDKYESNNSADGADLGAKSDCDGPSSLNASISPAQDIDFFHYAVSDDLYCSTYPDVTLTGLAADYDLCVWFRCKDGTSGSGVVGCDAGDYKTGGPNGEAGCCSSHSGLTVEHVRHNDTCSFQGLSDDSGIVTVQIFPKNVSAGSICGGYTLTWKAN